MTEGRTTATRTLLERLLEGDALATARIISLVENRSDETGVIYDRIFPETGRAHRIGLTGPPGAGKSTLVDGMARALLGAERRPAVVAVDPTSPFTGGALLGDRIRMRHLPPEVFIRSMASRGKFGGLAAATVGACDVLDAAGFDPLLIETVGVGQSEVDIADAADTTVVILNPGAGDGVQLLKAGMMEVADILVVNKADHDGADRLVEEIEAFLEFREGGSTDERPVPSVVRTVATEGKGIPDLLKAIESHRARQERSGRFEDRRRRSLEWMIRNLVTEEFHQRGGLFGEELSELAEKVYRREETPYTAMQTLLSRVLDPDRRPRRRNAK
jgi:LAO/AO transport system kinase